MEVAEGIHWKRIYWVNGPMPSKVRAAQAVTDPPCNGWSHAFVIDGPKRSTIICPYTLTAYQVPNNCMELAGMVEPTEWREKHVVELLLKNWTESQSLGFQRDYDTAAIVLKRLGVPVPHVDLRVGEDGPKERGGKAVEAVLKKPVKREGKRGLFLAWFLEGDGAARPVREAMAHFGMTRSNVLSYLFMLQKDHGIGYSLQGDLATICLPEGVIDPFTAAPKTEAPAEEEEDWLK